MSFKLNLTKTAAVFFAASMTVAGLTFMTVTSADSFKAGQEEETVYTSPSAGLSTQVLLQETGGREISVDFVSVSEVSAKNTQQNSDVISSINETIAEIEICVQEAESSAEEYSQADEAYELALQIYEEAQDLLEEAQSAENYAISSMYVQDVEELLEEAECASETAASAAQTAKEEEEAAAAAEKAAKEAAAKAAAQKAAKAAAASSSSSSSSSSGSSSQTVTESSDAASTRQALVNYAKSFVGVLKYKSGGSSLTSGADCSGFTQAIFAAYGYSLSRTSSGQASNGRSVSLSEIKVGDLVCYSGHVGIYIGNGQIVHSPGSGQYVKISSIYIMKIKSIRRIIE